jgi:hypothetical protein
MFLLSEDAVAYFVYPVLNLFTLFCFNLPIEITSKRPASDSDRSAGSKKHRRIISLAVKMDVLRRFDSGESAMTIGETPNLPTTMVRTIRASADKIKTSVGSSSSLSAAKTSRTCNRVMEKMEKMLAIWIED